MGTGHPDSLVPPRRGAVVRMYRAGLGDCFLLGFSGGDGSPRYVLIDCGTWKGAEGATGRMLRVMQSVRDSTGGCLDVVVVTHEHWDHLCGFHLGKAAFDGITIREVWLPWTEDPADELARTLRRSRAAALNELTAAAQQLGTGRAGDLAAGVADRVVALLDFFGGGALTGPARTADILESVRSRVIRPKYCRPGDALAIPGVPDMAIHVLGPPRNVRRLRKVHPSRATSETYVGPEAAGTAVRLFSTMGAAQLSGSTAVGSRSESDYPFADSFGVRSQGAPQNRFLRRYYESSGQAWRRIDDDWLLLADQLALALDGYTNNTSLVLAFEFGRGGPVLLFPGDAQVGSWLSWSEHAYADGVTAADLLRRTVLYKVSHHGSHNATLRENGLELMTSPRLVSMLPVDEREARKPKGGNPDGWDMPSPRLLKALRDRSGGRLLRADADTVFSDATFPFHVRSTELFVECHAGPEDEPAT